MRWHGQREKTAVCAATRAEALAQAALVLWPGLILAVAIAAPLAASRPEGWFLYEALDPFCHQQADRSWHLDGRPLAVCARCFGVYAGMVLAALAGMRLPLKTIGGALALLAVSWALEFGGLAEISNGIRAGTGLVLGVSLGAAALTLAGELAPKRASQTASVPASNS